LPPRNRRRYLEVSCTSLGSREGIVVALRARPARVDGITYERGREPRE